jgi:hypothetical protein
MSLETLTGLPHPSGVRGFKSHLPHLKRTVYHIHKAIKLMYKLGVGAIIIALWTNNVVVLSY